MPRSINVHLLPALVEPAELAGKAVVVIDVLRATTTIIHALAAGANDVIPLLEVDEAREIAIGMPSEGVLGGERGGKRIAGFNLGNSPLEYTPAAVGGKTLIFTTTNGTRAMLRCKLARRILIAGFVNFSAVCRELATEEQIEIVCAGTNGHVTREDTLLAGAIVEEAGQALRNDQAEIAADAWRTAVGTLSGRDPLAAALRESHGGRNLIEIGQGDDIDLAAQIDRFDIVPELNVGTWRIWVP
jgi:2-phosphosulfolactate phosphatase